MSGTPLDDAIQLLNTNDGARFEAVKYLTSKMSYSDLRLITNHCLGLERNITMKLRRTTPELLTGGE